jgi:hypothetical protein
MPVIIMIGLDAAPRLTMEEVEKLFQFSFSVHDHTASQPQEPIYWHRSRLEVRELTN